MKKRSTSLAVWNDELENVERNRKTKYSITKDMIDRRLRPEPEIIENILENLEEKMKHYFNLFRMEKEKRITAEKNNYYLQEEIAKAYETLERNQAHTMKVEEKLKSIKDNHSSLIDTVRRIDLLYVQLDTLVQSFAGVCTQTATEVMDETASLKKRKQTIQMLLDYIYPCRTLDPRINTLYGLLYYQSVGLVNGKYTGPPVPPIPPVVPAEFDGWLPPSLTHHNKIKEETVYNEKRFSDMVNNEQKEQLQIPNNSSNNNTSSDKKSRSDQDDAAQGSSDLIGFDVRIGNVELQHKLDNPKIVCVVRYDNETAYSAIQNNKRITKSKSPDSVQENRYVFKVDSNINLNSLPPKQAGIIPKFKIDIHDVRGKNLIGTANCSFVNEKTLIKNAPWDIYSRSSKKEPENIGKIYVSIYPYPSKAKLPVETFKSYKNQHASQFTDSKDSSDKFHSHSGDLMKPSVYANFNESSTADAFKSNLRPMSSSISNSSTTAKKNTPEISIPVVHKVTPFKDFKQVGQNINKLSNTIPMKPKIQISSEKKPQKITFKPYSGKELSQSNKIDNSPKETISNKPSSAKSTGVTKTAKETIGKETSVKETSVKETSVKVEPKGVDILKKDINTLQTQSKENVADAQKLIKKVDNQNDPNPTKPAIPVLKGPIKSKFGDIKTDTQVKNIESKKVSEEKIVPKIEGKREEPKAEVKISFLPKKDFPLKTVEKENAKASTDLKNSENANKSGDVTNEKTKAMDSQNVAKASLNESTKETEKNVPPVKTANIVKIKVGLPKKINLFKTLDKPNPLSFKDLNSKKETDSVKESSKSFNKSEEFIKLKMDTKKQLSLQSFSKTEKVDTSKKIESPLKKSLLKLHSKNKNELTNSETVAAKETPSSVNTKEMGIQKAFPTAKKTSISFSPKKITAGNVNITKNEAVPSKIEKVSLIKLKPKLGLEKPKLNNALLSLKKTNIHSPESPIVVPDDDDDELKKIISNVQKKAIFIDKSKIKSLSLSKQVKPKIVKKFIPKYKASMDE